MYLPTHFQQENLTELFDCIEANPFASVMVVHEGEIEANHMPLELDRSAGAKGMLRGHIAKANRLSALLENALSAYVIFHADQAYISPSWYAGKQEHHRVVPTWNYRVVHVKGMIRKVTDEKHLLFIYLELGAMVGIYFKTNHMPVRFLIYIAITALTRLLISDIQHDHKADMDLVIITGSILILAVAILIVRYASWTFPSVIRDKHSDKPLPEGKTPRPQDDELA